MSETIEINIPPSKSITQRAFICAALSSGKCKILNPLLSEDTLLLASGLKKLGISISLDEKAVEITGNKGEFSDNGEKTLFMGNNGTGFRFLLTLANFYKNNVILTGNERMCQRPVDSLAEALKDIGFNVSYTDKKGFPPVKISPTNKILKNIVTVRAEKSSQFVSSLLLCSPLFNKDFTLTLNGKKVSFPYILLTVDIMKKFGVNVKIKGEKFLIKGNSSYKPVNYKVENDFSSASYFAAGSVITGKTIKLNNLFYNSSFQGDKKFLDIIKKMGANVSIENNCIIVSGGKLKGIETDMNNVPDMVPTLAVLASFAQGATVIKNIAHLKYKETDRIETVVKNLNKAGIAAVAGSDFIKIEPNDNNFLKCRIDPENDHRIAMSFSLLSIKNKHIEILNKDCVKKSFPNYWEEFSKLEK